MIIDISNVNGHHVLVIMLYRIVIKCDYNLLLNQFQEIIKMLCNVTYSTVRGFAKLKMYMHGPHQAALGSSCDRQLQM